MCAVTSCTMIRSTDHGPTIRREPVRFAREHGTKPAGLL